MSIRVPSSLVLLALFSIRLVARGAAIGDSLALVALCALYGWDLFLASKKSIDLNDDVRTEIANMKATLNALKVQKTMSR